MRRLASLGLTLALLAASGAGIAAVHAPAAAERHGVKCGWVLYPDGTYHYVCSRGP